MNNSKIKKAINDVGSYLVIRLSEDEKISRDRALERLMKTAVYASLLDPETGLYCEPKATVYDMLKAELNHHPEEILKV